MAGYGLLDLAQVNVQVTEAVERDPLTTHTGRWGATAMWNKLTDGTWASDAFAYTGIDGPVSGWC